MNKIDEEHLRTIQGQQKKLNELLNQIGYVSAQKHSLLHQFADVNKEVEEFKPILEEKYGQVNINLETGEYEPLEDSNLKVVKEEETTDA